MYTRYYDGYSTQMPKPIPTKAQIEECPPKKEESKKEETRPLEVKASTSQGGLGGFGAFGSDDILLIALIFLVATEASDDFLMPLILGALLLS